MISPVSPPKSRPAYSTGPRGALPAGIKACARCSNWPCRCEPQASLPAGKQAPRVRREKAGRGGKTVTTVSPLMLVRSDAAALLADLKKLCGSGGTIKATQPPGAPASFTLEVQGDHADKVTDELVRRGFPAKRAGG